MANKAKKVEETTEETKETQETKETKETKETTKKKTRGPFQEGFKIPFEFIVLVNENYIDIHEALMLAYVKSYKDKKTKLIKSQELLARSIGCSKRKIARIIDRLKQMGLLETQYRYYRYHVYPTPNFYDRILFFLMGAYKNSVERLPDLSIKTDRMYINKIYHLILILASFINADISDFVNATEKTRQQIEEYENKSKKEKEEENRKMGVIDVNDVDEDIRDIDDEDEDDQ